MTTTPQVTLPQQWKKFSQDLRKLNLLRQNRLLGTLVTLLIVSSFFFVTAHAAPPHATAVATPAPGPQYATYPTITYPSDAKARAQVQHGEYLAKMGDCIACHTNSKEHGKAYAGGLPFATPFGTFYSPNITPDKATGIGKWTDAEFIRSLHEGIAADDQNNFPVFPYVYFNRVTDQDILDIRSYLNLIPAVNQANRANELPFPLNWRFLQGGWKVLFFNYHKGVFQPDPKRSAEWNRGSYIVNGLEHCSMCHTPLNLFGAADTNKFLGGGMVDGYYAPNLTSYHLGKVPVQDIVDVFAKGRMLSGGKVQGPMAEVNHDSLQYMTPEDLRAIAVYLKTVPPVVEKQITLSGSKQEIGKTIYDETCSTCHANGSAGAPIMGDIDAWKPRIALGLPTLYKNAIVGIGSMPAKGTCMGCSDEQIKDVVDYIIDNSKPGSHMAVSVVRTAPAPIDNSVTKGKIIYEQHCASCHVKTYPITGDKTAWQPIVDQGMEQIFLNALNGKGKMPAMGGCSKCDTVDIEAAVKYMVQNSSNGNYTLW